MRSRIVTGLLAFAALAAAGVGVSGAAFTAGSANPGNSFAAASSFGTVSLNDPGTPLRGTVTLDAPATGTFVSVKIQRSPAGAGTWTDICTDTTSPYSCSFDTTGVGDGLYDLRAIATDNAARSTTSALVTNRRVDNTSPAVTMSDPGSPLAGSITVGATASDTGGSGVASVKIQRSPAGAGTWTDICTSTGTPYQCTGFDTTLLGDGLYDFRAIATDNAGNTATAATVANRRIDNVAPTVSLTDPGSPLRGTVTVSATASDGGGIASVKIQRSPAGAGTWTDICTDTTSPYSCSFDTTGVGDGLYDLRALADDGTQLVSSALVTNRRVDNTSPAVTMSDPGSPLAGSITVGATASDTGGSGVASVKIQRSPAGAGTWTDICTSTGTPYQCTGFDTTLLGDGLYDFRAIATDNAGNTATAATVANRRIDNVAPTVSLTDPGSPLRGTVTVSATASDSGGIASVKIQRSPAGAGTWTDICTDTTSPYSCSFDTTGVGDGLYDLRAIATDNAARSTTSALVTNRRVDNTSPAVTMSDPGSPLAGSITLGATSSDTGGSGVSSVTIYVSPAGAGSWSAVCTSTVGPSYQCPGFNTASYPDGLYDFRASAIDNAGNTAWSATVSNRRIDNTAPTSATLNALPASIRNGQALTGSGADAGSGVLSIAYFYCSGAGCTPTQPIGSSSVGPSYSVAWNSQPADGVYRVLARVSDAASNTRDSAVQSVTIDNTAPTATDIDATNGTGSAGVPDSGDKITFTYSETVLPGSILAGWNGTSTNVTVNFVNTQNSDSVEIWNSAVTQLLPLTATGVPVALAGNYITGNSSTSVAGTMVQTGSKIVVTLTGNPTGGHSATGLMTWTPTATVTDLAGNSCTTAPATSSSGSGAKF